MVVSKMELYELLRKADGADVDFLREGVRTLAQALMEVEVAAQIGAEHHQRTPGAGDPPQRLPAAGLGHPGRHGRAGGPQAAPGQLLPDAAGAAPAGRAGAGRGGDAVLRGGVSSWRVDDVARSMGLEGISKSQVLRICAELDEVVAAWRSRPLDGGRPRCCGSTRFR